MQATRLHAASAWIRTRSASRHSRTRKAYAGARHVDLSIDARKKGTAEAVPCETLKGTGVGGVPFVRASQRGCETTRQADASFTREPAPSLLPQHYPNLRPTYSAPG